MEKVKSLDKHKNEHVRETSKLKMEAAGSSETSVSVIPHNICNLHI
jgi:hypothetical protein